MADRLPIADYRLPCSCEPAAVLAEGAENGSRVQALVASDEWSKIITTIRATARRLSRPSDWDDLESDAVLLLLSYAHEGRLVRSWAGLGAAVVRSNARAQRLQILRSKQIASLQPESIYVASDTQSELDEDGALATSESCRKRIAELLTPSRHHINLRGGGQGAMGFARTQHPRGRADREATRSVGTRSWGYFEESAAGLPHHLPEDLRFAGNSAG